MDLLDLKRYAIDHRVEIKFGNPGTAHECIISSKGLVKIPAEDKDFRIEEVLETAEHFVIKNDEGARNFTRDEMKNSVAQAGQKKKSGVPHEEEE